MPDKSEVPEVYATMPLRGPSSRSLLGDIEWILQALTIAEPATDNEVERACLQMGITAHLYDWPDFARRCATAYFTFSTRLRESTRSEREVTRLRRDAIFTIMCEAVERNRIARYKKFGDGL